MKNIVRIIDTLGVNQSRIKQFFLGSYQVFWDHYGNKFLTFSVYILCLVRILLHSS